MANALTPAQQASNAIRANAAARQAIASSSIEMMQSIFQQGAINPDTNPVVNVPTRNVGFITGFLLEITGTITNTDGTGGHTLGLTTFNLANVLQRVQFNDLQNNVRINTAGWHLNAINSARAGRPFGSAMTTDSPIAYGSNWKVISATGFPIAGGGANTGTFTMYYWVPLAYNPRAFDLRGGMFANVVNATANLQLTFASSVQAIVAPGTDATLAVVQGSNGSAGTITYGLTVYQCYLDQLPIDSKGQFILPTLDISTIYELKDTSLQGLLVGQDFQIAYPNFRDFMSTSVIYDRNGTLSDGTDINYWSLQSANLTNIFKKSPFAVALAARNVIGDDFPKGLYYFDHRAKPISTIQYGNMALNLNPSSVGSGARTLVGFEDLAYQNAVSGAGSLPNS